MKKLYTLLPLCVAAMININANAQKPQRSPMYEAIRAQGGNPQTIYIIGVDGKSDAGMKMKFKALDIYKHFNPTGYQESAIPNFIISDAEHKAIFAIGGFVNMRTAYDWDRVVGNKDFVTYNIPMSGNISNHQRFLMDPTTSRLFFKTIINTDKIGAVEANIETDFRGTNGGLRLRQAYVSFLGLTIGQATSTFSDLGAGPNLIDFQGPNSYTYNRTPLIRYKYDFNKHWSFAVAAEMPVVSATPGTQATIIPQRIPDIPLYFQYSWNESKSHLRASGVVRGMFYNNHVTGQTLTNLGWGAQFSGNLYLCKNLSLYGMAVYGKGISSYLQDLSGQGLDMVDTPYNAGTLSVVPAMGWFAGAEINITPRLQMNMCYSQIRLYGENNSCSLNENTYRFSQYMVANMFYNILPSLQLGVEYLYGTRYNTEWKMGAANRVQASLQFNF